MLHFIPDTDDPAAIVANLASVLAPGSFVVISHLTADLAPSQVNAGVAAYSTWVPAGLTARSHTQVSALFGGLPLVPPGVVPVSEWRPALASHRPPATRPVRRAGPHPGSTDVTTARGPGHDEITLTVPTGPHLCCDRAHRRLGRLADVIVSFGQLGDPRIPRECLLARMLGQQLLHVRRLLTVHPPDSQEGPAQPPGHPRASRAVSTMITDDSPSQGGLMQAGGTTRAVWGHSGRMHVMGCADSVAFRPRRWWRP